MSAVHPIKNTDKSYLCTNCGEGSVSIIRDGTDPRLKCNTCNFVFNGSDSKAAEIAGAIPNGPPKLEDPNPPKTDPARQPIKREDYTLPELLDEPKERRIQAKPVDHDDHSVHVGGTRIPRKIDYVLVSKDRKKTEFIQEKDLKKVVLRWESGNQNYELFELQPKKSSVNIDIE